MERIKEITEMPYYPELSGDSIYWNLTKEGWKIIPYLVDHLDDTTQISVFVPNIGGYYTVGDVSFMVLNEIIHDLPSSRDILVQMCKDKNCMDDTTNILKAWESEGAFVWYRILRDSVENRRILKKYIKQWLRKNKNKLVWKVDTASYHAARNWPFPSNKYPPGGYYILKKD